MRICRSLASIACSFVIASLASPGAAKSINEPLPVVPEFNINKYLGSWYEIARFPTTSEVGCRNAVMHYASKPDKPGYINLISECDRLGAVHTRLEAELSSPDADYPARMVMEYRAAGIKHHFNYYVLAVGDNYEWALVGEPNRDYLWIFSRQPQLEPEVLRELINRASSEFGYEKVAKRLRCTTQPGGVSKLCEGVLP